MHLYLGKTGGIEAREWDMGWHNMLKWIQLVKQLVYGGRSGVLPYCASTTPAGAYTKKYMNSESMCPAGWSSCITDGFGGDWSML
ncbi:hypothetical protein Hdeb2414_s0016g00483321 [Helianthus debilis subsp. tardiflorus]